MWSYRDLAGARYSELLEEAARERLAAQLPRPMLTRSRGQRLRHALAGVCQRLARRLDAAAEGQPVPAAWTTPHSAAWPIPDSDA
jgi:hypothetical protein